MQLKANLHNPKAAGKRQWAAAPGHRVLGEQPSPTAREVFGQPKDWRQGEGLPRGMGRRSSLEEESPWDIGHHSVSWLICLTAFPPVSQSPQVSAIAGRATPPQGLHHHHTGTVSKKFWEPGTRKTMNLGQTGQRAGGSYGRGHRSGPGTLRLHEVTGRQGHPQAVTGGTECLRTVTEGQTRYTRVCVWTHMGPNHQRPEQGWQPLGLMQPSAGPSNTACRTTILFSSGNYTEL